MMVMKVLTKMETQGFECVCLFMQLKKVLLASWEIMSSRELTLINMIIISLLTFGAFFLYSQCKDADTC